jgi:hypothetical protein
LKTLMLDEANQSLEREFNVTWSERRTNVSAFQVIAKLGKPRDTLEESMKARE